MTPDMAGYVVAIGGGGRQIPAGIAPAIDIYVGSFIHCARSWVESLAPTPPLYVVSARYGLIPHDRRVHTYSPRVNFKGAQGAPRVSPSWMAGQLAQLFPQATGATPVRMLLIGGVEVERALREACPPGVGLVIDRPFARESTRVFGDARMGYQSSTLNAWHGRVPPLRWEDDDEVRA